MSDWKLKREDVGVGNGLKYKVYTLRLGGRFVLRVVQDTSINSVPLPTFTGELVTQEGPGFSDDILHVHGKGAQQCKDRLIQKAKKFFESSVEIMQKNWGK